MGRKANTKRKRIGNFEDKPGREKPDEGREHITKYLQKVYGYVTKESDLFWGLKDQDIVPVNSKRIPGTKRAKIDTTKRPEDDEEQRVTTVSEGYGEATLGSISRLLRTLETLEDEDLRLSRNSTFVDIGSGYGKVVFHARLFSHVKRSFGIEFDIAQRAREYFRFRHILEAKPETNKENHAGNGVPLTTEDDREGQKNVEEEMGELLDIEDVDFVCDDATNRSPFNFSHIYIYEKLLPQLETSPFKILVSFRTLLFLTSRGLTHIRPLGTIRISSTGRQCFTAHIYAKTKDESLNATTANSPSEQHQQQDVHPQATQMQQDQIPTQILQQEPQQSLYPVILQQPQEIQPILQHQQEMQPTISPQEIQLILQRQQYYQAIQLQQLQQQIHALQYQAPPISQQQMQEPQQMQLQEPQQVQEPQQIQEQELELESEPASEPAEPLQAQELHELQASRESQTTTPQAPQGAPIQQQQQEEEEEDIPQLLEEVEDDVEEEEKRVKWDEQLQQLGEHTQREAPRGIDQQPEMYKGGAKVSEGEAKGFDGEVSPPTNAA